LIKTFSLTTVLRCPDYAILKNAGREQNSPKGDIFIAQLRGVFTRLKLNLMKDIDSEERLY